MADLNKDVLKTILDKVYVGLEELVDKTKTESRRIDIGDVPPTKLNEFLQENNIPESARFASYYGEDEACLEWDITSPTTEEEQEQQRINLFSSRAFSLVYDYCISNGYSRRFVLSQVLNKFKDKPLLTWYREGNFEMLLEYYNLKFSKQ